MEGGYEEYRLLHFYERNYQKDAKYILILSLVILIILGCGSAFELMHVNLQREKPSSPSPSPSPVNNNSSSTTLSPPSLETIQLSIFTFYRCQFYGNQTQKASQTTIPDLGNDDCKLAVFGNEKCFLENLMMWLMAISTAASFIFLGLCISGAARTLCTKKPTIGFLWFSTTALVITTCLGAAGIVVIVAADNALCSSGTNLAAASLPGFYFGPSFWLLIAAPVLSVGNAALSFQTC